MGLAKEAKKKEEEELMFLKQRSSENRNILRFYHFVCYKIGCHICVKRSTNFICNFFKVNFLTCFVVSGERLFKCIEHVLQVYSRVKQHRIVLRKSFGCLLYVP